MKVNFKQIGAIALGVAISQAVIVPAINSKMKKGNV